MANDLSSENKVVSADPAPADLSREVELSAERQPDESIRAVRVFENHYRCNWWVKEGSPQSFWLASGTIRKSSLLRATMTTSGLKIEDVTIRTKPRE